MGHPPGSVNDPIISGRCMYCASPRSAFFDYIGFRESQSGVNQTKGEFRVSASPASYWLGFCLQGCCLTGKGFLILCSPSNVFSPVSPHPRLCSNTFAPTPPEFKRIVVTFRCCHDYHGNVQSYRSNPGASPIFSGFQTVFEPRPTSTWIESIYHRRCWMWASRSVVEVLVAVWLVFCLS